ncbi:MAG: ACT domain-containing protein [Deltaproteobacteria bacterium]|nr:ACT domain-containing protein [Deltaproteobacteria bacterium]
MRNKTFILSVLPERLGICKYDPSAPIPEWAYQFSFFSITRTSDELSIVCNETHIPEEESCSIGWRCLKIKGPLDFSETGILASLSRTLAAAGVPIFVLSTYETDYILVKDKDLARAVEALENDGHKITDKESRKT